MRSRGRVWGVVALLATLLSVYTCIHLAPGSWTDTSNIREQPSEPSYASAAVQDTAQKSSQKVFQIGAVAHMELSPLIESIVSWCPTTIPLPSRFAPRLSKQFSGFVVVHAQPPQAPIACSFALVNVTVLKSTHNVVQWHAFGAPAHCKGLTLVHQSSSATSLSPEVALGECFVGCMRKSWCVGFAITSQTSSIACRLFRCTSPVKSSREYMPSDGQLYLLFSSRPIVFHSFNESNHLDSLGSSRLSKRVSGSFVSLTNFAHEDVLRLQPDDFFFDLSRWGSEVTLRSVHTGEIVSSVPRASASVELRSSKGAILFTTLLSMRNGRCPLSGDVHGLQEFVGSVIVMTVSVSSGMGWHNTLVWTGKLKVHRFANAVALWIRKTVEQQDRDILLASHTFDATRTLGPPLYSPSGAAAAAGEDSQAQQLSTVVDITPSMCVSARACGADYPRDDEFCFRHVAASAIDTNVDGYEHASFESGALTVLALTLEDHTNCFSVVDGFHAKLNAYGTYAFEHLILRLHNSTHCRRFLEDGASAVDVVVLSAIVSSPGSSVLGTVPAVNITLYSRQLALCAERGLQEMRRQLSASKDITPDKRTLTAAVTTPVLVSVTVHRCPSCLHDLLENIFLFASPCVVVLHISATGSLSREDAQRVVGDRPHVFINPLSVPVDSGLYMHIAHFSNIKFMLEQPVVVAAQANAIRRRDAHRTLNIRDWTHVLFFQWNERFVKRGVVEYVRRYEASRPLSEESAADLLRFHDANCRFVSPRDVFRRAARGAKSVLFERMQDQNLFRVLQARAARRRERSHDASVGVRSLLDQGIVQPSCSVRTEGMFLSRRVAAELAHDVLATFDVDDASIMGGIIHEYVTAVLLLDVCATNSSVRCGDRIGIQTMMRRDGQVFLQDLRRARCSPYGPPFSMKRFAGLTEGGADRVDEMNAAAGILAQISADAERFGKVREDSCSDVEHLL